MRGTARLRELQSSHAEARRAYLERGIAAFRAVQNGHARLLPPARGAAEPAADLLSANDLLPEWTQLRAGAKGKYTASWAVAIGARPLARYDVGV